MATGKGRLYHANGDIYEGVSVNVVNNLGLGRA